jgi:hypothetical protein
MAQPRKLFPFTLLFMWGALGAVAGCCVLWIVLSIASEIRELLFSYSNSLLSWLGFSKGFLAALLFLHLQFAGCGFVFGVAFRFLGMRKQIANRHGNPPEHN